MTADGDFNGSSLPLRGAVLCCTSIPPELRAEMSAQAEQMGALNLLDLTSEVTHLVVGELNTPKYRYVAKERPDVKVLDRHFIEAVRQSWIQGGDTDVAKLEEKHRLPVFGGLRICFTGFDDYIERQELQELVTANGAEYHADLTKQVTHLLAKKPEGKKYLYATNWGLHIVAEEWLRDSLERGMTLDEREYAHTIPSNERGKNARKKITTTSLGKRSRTEDEAIAIPGGQVGGKRKLRRSASEKLGSQNVGIWDDIVGGGFGEKAPQKSAWEDDANQGQSTTEKASTAVKEKTLNAMPSQTTSSSVAAMSSLREVNQISPLRAPLFARPNGDKGIFHNRKFFLHDFDQPKTVLLRQHLTSHGAVISSSISELAILPPDSSTENYVVVPHHLPLSECPKILEDRAVLITEWWIERCMISKEFIDPKEDVRYRPFPTIPLAGFENLSVSTTGFTDINLLHVSRLITLMGATYDQSLFSKTTSVLVCNSTTCGTKLQHAFKWKIPAVSAAWLWDSVQDGKKRPLGPYSIAAPKCAEGPATEVVINDKTSIVPQERGQNSNKHGPEAPPRNGVNVHSGEREPRDGVQHPKAAAGNELDPISDPLDLGHATKPTSPTQRQGRDNETNPSAHDTKSKRGMPLQELGPDLNPSTNDDILVDSEPPSVPPESDAYAPEDIGKKIAELLKHQKEQLCRDNPLPEERGRRPRNRLLGRAPSNTSSRASLPNSLSRASSVSVDEAGNGGSSKPISSLVGEPELLPQERYHVEKEAPAASQVLTYEDPEAQEHQERVMRKIQGLGPAPVKEKYVRTVNVARDSANVKRSMRQRTYR